jgi:hypothetical protein
VANGDNDIMVPTPNSRDMARRIPGADLVIYPDAAAMVASSNTTRSSCRKRWPSWPPDLTLHPERPVKAFVVDKYKKKGPAASGR